MLAGHWHGCTVPCFQAGGVSRPDEGPHQRVRPPSSAQHARTRLARTSVTPGIIAPAPPHACTEPYLRPITGLAVYLEIPIPRQSQVQVYAHDVFQRHVLQPQGRARCR